MAESLVVDAQALSKNYASIKALDAVSFQVRPGEIFGLIGADGAGKTTAFRIIGGVLEAGGGEVHVLDTTPRHARPGVRYITQPFSRFPDLSIDENHDYAASVREVPKEDFN